jgi:hypothetical protein
MAKTVENIAHTIIPAQSGWELVVPDVAGGIKATPVIAWEIERYERDEDRSYCSAKPVTALWPDVEELGHGLWALKRPDGKFENRRGREFIADFHLIEYFKGFME